MDAALFERARAGHQEWQDGDLSALEELLDPDVARVCAICFPCRPVV